MDNLDKKYRYFVPYYEEVSSGEGGKLIIERINKFVFLPLWDIQTYIDNRLYQDRLLHECDKVKCIKSYCNIISGCIYEVMKDESYGSYKIIKIKNIKSGMGFSYINRDSLIYWPYLTNRR